MEAARVKSASMIQNPPPFESNRDREQLKLLEVFHYVMGGLAVAGTAFLFIHYTIMSTAFSNPQMWQHMNPPPPFDPTQFFHAFVWFYLFMGAWGLVSLVTNLASAWCIRTRKYRFFSMIVAGFNCINLPFGTGLGVCTLIVLLRPTMPSLYHESPPTA
jgi:hypothetical protein